MHILTKVFVVLVSLLAVAIVPLAAVQASSQAALKQQIKDRDLLVSTKESQLSTATLLRVKVEEDLQSQITVLDSERNQLQTELAQQALRLRSLETEIAQSKVQLAGLNETVRVSIDTDRAKAALIKTINEELIAERTRASDCEQARLAVESKLGKTESDLRVAKESLAESTEQVASLTNERVKADQVVQTYSARFGSIDEAVASSSAATIPADRNLTAHLINVRRTGERVYGEIDAGSRDGVKVGWLMTIGDDSYVGKLRITSVDVNRAVGTIESEDAANRGEATVGQRVTIRKGK